LFCSSESIVPKVTEAHVAARKLQIINAACICFGQNGFHHSSMQDICKAAGLSPGAVYSYFASKEELIGAILEAALAQSATILAQVGEKLTTRDSIAEITRIYLESVDRREEGVPQPYDPFRVKVGLWAESLRNAELLGPLKGNYIAIRDELTRIVQRGKERGELAVTVDPTTVIQLLLSLIEGYTLQRAIDETIDQRRYFQAVDALLDGGLLGPATHATSTKPTAADASTPLHTEAGNAKTTGGDS
jgi:AcrR family transcriptional regulator